jgi:hypothetical protein
VSSQMVFKRADTMFIICLFWKTFQYLHTLKIYTDAWKKIPVHCTRIFYISNIKSFTSCKRL